MRKAFALGAAAVLVIVATLLVVLQTRASRPAVSDSIDPAGPGQAGETSRDTPEPAAPPSRNVFEYQAEAARDLRDPGPIPTSLVPPPPLTPAPPPRVRLIGLVIRASGLRAALLISGEIAILGPGEQASGYAVVSIDEDFGVKLRDPQGSELTLPIDSRAPTEGGDGGTHQPAPSDSPRT